MDAKRGTTSGRVASVEDDGRPELARARETTMKAIAQDAYGSADVLELRDIDKPEIGDNEVLIRVHAAGVDRGCGTS